VIGVDCDAGLVKALNGRAKGLALRAEIADARNFQLSSEFGLALAPMQLVQLLGGAEQRVACLRCVASHLRPGARVALAIVELMPGLQAGGSPLPDICEVEGWAYSSLPIETRVGADSIFIRRLRQVVSPTGELSEEVIEIGLRPLSAELLESEGVAAGLIASGRREIPATDANVGSTVILLEKAP